MASDYTKSKSGLGELLPAGAVDAGFSRYEPLLTPQRVRDSFLYGIKLVSPETGQVMTDDMIQDHILDAVGDLEMETSLNIFPTRVDERYEFDRNEYMQMGYFRLRQRPVSSVQSLRVVTSNDQIIWEVNLDWVDTGYLDKGMIYIIPINVAVAPSASSGGGAGGAAFLAILGQQAYVPAYWRLVYTTGWTDGRIPRSVNSMIGCDAGIKILNQLAAANARNQSKSLGIDGLSQSSSNPGPAVYQQALDALKERKMMLVNRFKTKFGQKIFAGNV